MNVGILGGGQLGRMCALAGYPLGLRFKVLEPEPDPPAGQVAPIVAGRYDDEAALRQFASLVDVVTYEFENVPVESARLLAQRVPVFPPPQALAAAQDRLAEKTLFTRLGVPTPAFAAVDSFADLAAAVERLGLPAVLKTRRFGYDGKGQFVLRVPRDIDEAWRQLGFGPLLLEAFVPFQRELSVLAVRGRQRELALYPLVENHHREGILRLSLAPAPALTESLQQQAQTHATAVMEELDYVGLLAIEFFERHGQLWANEMAPRVHNSGHWTMDGAECCQFQNHLRAVAGLPLGSTAALGACAMVNLIGTVPPLAELLTVAGARVHLYDKAPRARRKLGHVNVCARSEAARIEQLAALRQWIEFP